MCALSSAYVSQYNVITTANHFKNVRLPIISLSSFNVLAVSRILIGDHTSHSPLFFIKENRGEGGVIFCGFMLLFG